MKTSDVLAPLEKTTLTRLLKKSDAKAFAVLGFNYGLIAACFAAVILKPTTWMWIAASAVLAGRQLGLAILMHDCAHSGFFEGTRANKFFGKWFCAAPVFADLDQYRTYHLEHHRTAGSEADPDRSNYIGYPVSGRSLFRKFFRDMIGITGFKIFLIVLKMNAGTVKYQLSYDSNKKSPKIPVGTQLKNIVAGLYPTMIVHAAAALGFILSGHGEAYWLWWVAWMTFYMAFSRLRNAAEHGATIDMNDLSALKNTRTTLAAWWERLFVAPNYVNYHLEHHLLPTIPSYNLPEFHHELMKVGALKESKIASGYAEVLSDLRSDER